MEPTPKHLHTTDSVANKEELPDHLIVLLSKEQRWTSSASCIDTHPALTTGMRRILIDWLMEVCCEYRLRRITLHRAVELLDHFLHATESKVSRGGLQLVGISCLLIAAKFEEIFPPHIDDMIYICDNAYSAGQLMEMESVVLRDIGWKVCRPIAYEWLEWWLCVHERNPPLDQVLATFTGSEPPPKLSLVCRLLLDTTLLTVEALEHSPSTLARACLNAGQMIIGERFEPEDGLKRLTIQCFGWAVDAIGMGGIVCRHERSGAIDTVKKTAKLLLNSLQSAKELGRANSLKSHRLSVPNSLN